MVLNRFRLFPLSDIPVDCLPLVPSFNVHASVKEFRFHVLQ